MVYMGSSARWKSNRHIYETIRCTVILFWFTCIVLITIHDVCIIYIYFVSLAPVQARTIRRFRRERKRTTATHRAVELHRTRVLLRPIPPTHTSRCVSTSGSRCSVCNTNRQDGTCVPGLKGCHRNSDALMRFIRHDGRFEFQAKNKMHAFVYVYNVIVIRPGFSVRFAEHTRHTMTGVSRPRVRRMYLHNKHGVLQLYTSVRVPCTRLAVLFFSQWRETRKCACRRTQS